MAPAPQTSVRVTGDALTRRPQVPSSSARVSSTATGRLFGAIFVYLLERPEAGRLFLAPLDVVLSHYDVVEPDLLFVAREELTAEDGGTLTTPLLPGCGIDVRTLFRPTL
jgi:hypothetical protein